MEDKKNAMRLDDEKMEQVAGGWGSEPYTECHIYQDLLRIKNEGDVDYFKDRLRYALKDDCPMFMDGYYCGNCPVRCEWRWEYGV